MALTDRKRRFIAALQSGLTGAKAAIHAGYSEKGAAVAASRLMKDPDIAAALQRHDVVNKAKEQARAEGKEISLPDLGKMFSDPKEFLRALMNDPAEDTKLRLEAAKTLMPFEHGKVAEQGKKAAKDEAAKKASGRFAPPAPPTHLRVVGK